MHAEARLRFYKGSAQKVRLVADTVRGHGVPRALSVLKLTHRRCARDLEKLVRSAVANLEQKSPGIDSGQAGAEEHPGRPGPEPEAFPRSLDGACLPQAAQVLPCDRPGRRA